MDAAKAVSRLSRGRHKRLASPRPDERIDRRMSGVVRTTTASADPSATADVHRSMRRRGHDRRRGDQPTHHQIRDPENLHDQTMLANPAPLPRSLRPDEGVPRRTVRQRESDPGRRGATIAYFGDCATSQGDVIASSALFRWINAAILGATGDLESGDGWLERLESRDGWLERYVARASGSPAMACWTTPGPGTVVLKASHFPGPPVRLPSGCGFLSWRSWLTGSCVQCFRIGGRRGRYRPRSCPRPRP